MQAHLLSTFLIDLFLYSWSLLTGILALDKYTMVSYS